MPSDPAVPPHKEKESPLKNALREKAVVVAVPLLIGVVAQVALPLKQIALMLPESFRSYVMAGQNVGELMFALALAVYVPIDTWRHRHRRLGHHPRGSFQPGKINVWVAELEGDDEHQEARRRMMTALDGLFRGAVAILAADIAPHLVDTGIAGEEAGAGNRLAQQFLEENQGDMILWGQYFAAPAPLIELRIVSSAQDGRQAVPFEYDTATFRPAEKKFRPYFAAALAALIASLAQTVDEDTGSQKTETLRALTDKVARLAGNLPDEVSLRERARIFEELGKLYRQLGWLDDSMPKLRMAARLLLRARRCWRRAGNADAELARTALALGRTWWKLGEKTEGLRFLSMSLQVLDMPMAFFTPEKDFAQWARCRAERAAALSYTGRRLRSIPQLEEGVVAMDMILERPEIVDYPELHAKAFDSLAVLCGELAILEQSAERYAQSSRAFEELLNFWTKDHRPLDWARTHLNIVSNLLNMHDLDQRREWLERAWGESEKALEVYSRDCQPAQFGKAKACMGDILFAQRQWKEAADLYLEALEVLNPETDEVETLRAKQNLDVARAEMRGGDMVVLLNRPPVG